MTSAITLDEQVRRLASRVTLLQTAILLLGLAFFAVCGGGFVLWQVYERSFRYDSLSVGMTVEDVQELFGEPDRQSKAGEPLDPPNISGFVPHRQDYAYVFTYQTPFTFVYLFFDESDRVIVHYVHGV